MAGATLKYETTMLVGMQAYRSNVENEKIQPYNAAFVQIMSDTRLIRK